MAFQSSGPLYFISAVVGNVAFGSLTDHSSLATGSNSSFVVDDNLTTCFSSKVVREQNAYTYLRTF